MRKTRMNAHRSEKSQTSPNLNLTQKVKFVMTLLTTGYDTPGTKGTTFLKHQFGLQGHFKDAQVFFQLNLIFFQLNPRNTCSLFCFIAGDTEECAYLSYPF